MVRTEVAFTPTAAGAKALVALGWPRTVSVAAAPVAVPWFVVTLPVLLL